MSTDQQQFGALPPAQPKKKSGCTIIGLVALAALGGCVALALWGGKALLQASEEIGKYTDEVFAANVAGKWAELYDTQTTPEFQSVTNREQWNQIGAVVQEKLGALKNKTTTNINVRSMNGVTTAVVLYSAQFEKGAGTIEMNLRKDAGQWKILGLHVNSPLLASAPSGTCPHCGKSVPADAKFCPACGKAADAGSEKTGAVEDTQSPTENPPPAENPSPSAE